MTVTSQENILASLSMEKNVLHGGYINGGYEKEHATASPPSLNGSSKQASPEKVESPPMDFDDLLPHVGEFGRYQKTLFLLMIPFAFFVAFVYFSQIFLTLVPEEHWCHVPELNNFTQEQR